MTSPRLVPGLVTLREQINQRWPARDKASDGWIGDAAHAARESDHNPDADGWVHAIDVDKDGIHADQLARELVAYAASGLPGSNRVKNIVWNDQVASGTYAATMWVFRGSGYGHFDHIHVSATDAAEWDPRPWPLPCLTRSKWTRVTRFPRTGVYEAKSEHSRRVGWRAFRPFPTKPNVEYVNVEKDSIGRDWLETPAGNWILAKATAFKRG